ncbi:MAG: DUF2357 domain-containing protein, partial [Clostridia bacterium]|nr:DUF2357 domain-containing protein [Clostridia bacterium]
MAEETVQQRSEKFRDTLSSVLHELSKRNLSYAEAQMLIGSADANASLSKNTIHKVIDADWITVIEEALPYLDIVVRMPGVAIEDVDEILPVEISRHITEKSIRHLAQHTNLIQKIEGDEVTPSRILNVYHEETLFTYENKFVNTLLHRLYAFIEKRYAQIHGTSGVEQNYSLEYTTSFQQETAEGKLAKGKVSLQIELTTPTSVTLTEEELLENERYQKNLERLERIHSIVLSYMGSPLVRTLGRTFIRPPVIRTNAILKNKNLKVALNLWEFIESFEKVGYYFSEDATHQLPADSYISALYSTVAAQYLDFYQSIVGEEDIKRELSRRHLSDIYPEFEDLFNEEDEDEYNIYDSEYRKLVPVSRLLNNKRKLSDDEKRMRIAIAIALAADRTLEENRLAEKRRKAEEELQRQAEEEARARAEADAELARLLGEQAAQEPAPEAPIEEVTPAEEPVTEAPAEEQTLDTEPATEQAPETSDAEPVTDSHSEQSEESHAEPALNGFRPEELAVRYRHSFLSKLIQSDKELQQIYTEIKNLLLSYRGVKARMSFANETFKKAKVHISKLNVKGKSLTVELALNPENYSIQKYHFIDNSAKNPELPMMMKVRSERSLRYCLELIEEQMRVLGLEKDDTYIAQDFTMPYETTEELAKRGLVKVIYGEGTAPADTTVADTLGQITPASETEQAPEAPIEEVTPAEEPVTEQAPETPDAEP